jgi:hypothetical protein
LSGDLSVTAPPPRAEPAPATPAIPLVSRPARHFDRSIVEGPIAHAVWKIAWPTVLQNAIGGLQGIIDHAMVGHYVGYTANAAIGVSWQIFLVVIVFISSVFTGMGVLVARFAGANQPDKVNRTVYQACLTAIVLALGIMAPVGYLLSPYLLELVHATPEVRAEALPFLRTMFVYSVGMLMFFMLGGALRAAGDARTPLRLGVALTVLNIALNVMLIPGYGPVPALGTRGAAIGTSTASMLVSGVGLWLMLSGRLVVSFPRTMSWRPDWSIIRSLFRFGLPAGVQGVAMNLAGVMLLRFIGSLQHSAEAQADHVDVRGADGRRRGRRWPEPRRRSSGQDDARGVDCLADRTRRGRLRQRDVPPDSRAAALDLRVEGSDRRGHRQGAPSIPEHLGILHHGRTHLHGRIAGYGRHAEPPLHHARVADRRSNRSLRDLAGDRAPFDVRSMDRHSPGTSHALRPDSDEVQTGEMAHHRCGVIFRWMLNS